MAAKVNFFRFTFAPPPDLAENWVETRAGHVITVRGTSARGASILAATIYRRTYHLPATVSVTPTKSEIVRPSIPRSR